MYGHVRRALLVIGQADVVLLAHAWTVLEDPVQHLQFCLRKLKPTGKVCMRVAKSFWLT